ncbi:hypothetical protein KFK14_06565 [Sphingobium phenoxybenzoativorans]|uniref:Transmembrane protein n=1 Tax=Sphingobium phenoxybenzoativorans TaxID=1592790 RepID=A0A975K946_9SPHN|nr:hypothetical protein [Sphingobium phenoxybenzoativorans]QUT07081.1 hypothetical protein KFK14_06565 [Sphingobium phenoxybenzoativorans]
MSNDATDINPDIIRRVGELELASATHSRTVLLEAHQDAYKWLLASLLAINSAGIFTLLSFQLISIRARVIIAILFYLGIMAALLSSYLSQRANRALIGPLGELMGYWITVAHDGELLPEAFEAINQKIQSAVQQARPTQVAGWASAVFFSLGVISVGIMLIYSPLPSSIPTHNEHHDFQSSNH